MEHGAFSTSESENDAETYRGETSRAASRRALLERSLTQRTGDGQLTYYTVLASDLCTDFVDVGQYHMKLLTPVDVHHIFKGTQELYAMIMEVEFGRGSYLVMLADEMHRDASTRKVATVMAAPSLAIALTKLDVGFAVNARFADGRSEMLPLAWKLSDDGEHLELQIESVQTIAVTTSQADELVFYDVHFTRGGEPAMDFVVVRASTTVGEFARAVTIDTASIDLAHDRMFFPTTRTVRTGVSLESYARVQPATDGDEPHRPIQAMENGSATSIRDARTVQSRAMTSYESWQNITRTHRTADGWNHMVPGRQFAQDYNYAEAELDVVVHVYTEDEILRAFNDKKAAAENAIATRQIKHCVTAMKSIENARISARAGEDPADLAYLTMDESHVRAIDEMREGPRTPEDEAAAMMTYYYVIHRFRAQFGDEAFRELVFPETVKKLLASDGYVARLENDLSLTKRYIHSEAVKGVVELEATEGVPRVVLLRDWSMRIPTDFVGSTLTKMIDSEVYRVIYEKSQAQRAVQKSVVHAGNVATTSRMWTLLASAFGLFSSCSSARNGYDTLKQ